MACISKASHFVQLKTSLIMEHLITWFMVTMGILGVLKRVWKRSEVGINSMKSKS